MSKINATSIGIYIGGTLIGASTSGELSLSGNMIDVTSKDSGGDSEFLPGLRSGTMSVEGLVTDDDADYNQSDLFAAHIAGTELAIKYGVNTTGKKRFSAAGFITSLSQSAGMEDVATFSAEFQLTGAITEETIA
jgi:TP901-1 family phage major tail protein